MKKIFKRAAALFLAAVTAVSLSACGKEPSSTTGGKTDEPGTQGGNTAESNLNEVGTYPIVKEPIEMSMFCMSGANIEDMQTNDFTKWMEEKTGIRIKFETGTRDDWQDKLNLAFSTNSYTDMIMFVSADEARYGVKEQILLQLDDLIDANMPNYKEKMGEYIDSTRQTDGHIYSIAGLNDCYHCQYGRKMWVNTYHLEQMGVEVPTTTEEFYDVCKKFLEYKPDGIAVAGANSGWFVRFEEFLMNAFILDPGIQQSYRDKTVVTPEGKVISIATTDEYKEGLRYMNSLYQLGAIYDGNFTQTSEQLRTLLNQADEPVLFVPFGTISDGIDAVANNETYRHYQPIAPLKGPEGVQIATYFKYDGVNENSFAITDKCKYPEAALRWADWFFTDFADLYTQFGAEEGKDWVLNPPGKTGLSGEPALYEVLNQYSAEVQNHDWQDVCLRYAPASYRLGAATDANVDKGTAEGLEKLLYDATKNLMEPYAQKEGELDILPYLKFTSEEATEIQTIGVEVENYIEENKVAFITGAKDIDKEWDSYVKAFDNLGLPKLIEVYQKAYDRQSSK